MPDQTQAPAAPSGQGPAVGKATSAPAKTTPSAQGTAAVGKPHFEYEWEDGTKESYATEEDFKRAWRDGRLRHKDYTKKTQELAEQRKAFDQERQKLEQVAGEARKLHGQWKPVDDWLKSRPDVSDYIVKNMRNPTPDAIAEQVRAPINQELEQTKSQLQQLMEWKQKREEEEKKQQIYDHLSKQYEDFSPEEIEEELNRFNESPDEDDPMKMAELLYWARKGRAVPRKVGETVVAGPAGTSRKMPPVPSAKAMREAPEEKPKSLREAAEIYKRKHAND